MSRRGISVAVVVVIAWGGLAAAIVTDTMPRLGLDLQGGTSVILQVPEGTDEELVKTAVEVMRRRIEDFGSVQEPEIAITGGTSGATKSLEDTAKSATAPRSRWRPRIVTSLWPGCSQSPSSPSDRARRARWG